MAAQNHTVDFRRFSRFLFFLGITLIFSIPVGPAYSANLTLAWDANSEPDLIGYRVYCGESSGNYSVNHYITSSNPSEPPPTTCEFADLEEGKTYYLAAKAISQTGESDYSQEISYTVPAALVDPQDIDNDGDGLTENQGDCNDNSATVYPGAEDICGDGIDQDCSGADLICPQDIDNDGDDYTENQGDCNDADSSINPGATDLCGDGIDQDCSGADVVCPDDNSLVREAQAGELIGDFEIISDPMASSGTYVYVPNGVGTRMDGPDETHKIIYSFNLLKAGNYRIKGAVYAANGSDDSFWVKVNGSPVGGYLWDVLQNTSYQQDYVNDRNGADPVEVSLKSGPNTVTVYLREDGTRLERIELESVATTAPPSDIDGDGYTAEQGDCNDIDADINPGATDSCGDGIDQDCSGSDLTCPEDIDNDGDGVTENQGDCNDTNSSIHPYAQEVCGDGIDQDCSGADLICPEDIDDDGDGYTENTGDCDDTKTSINPGATEICGDGIDQDCSGSDLTCPGDIDNDGDGFSVSEGDCDDMDVAVHPGAEDVCGDGIDQDCNGSDLPCVEVGSELPIEFGEIQVNHEWQKVTLKSAYTNPIVITSAVGYSNQDPAVIRVRNVDSSGFEVRVQEWDYLDGQHASEQVNYIVVESGSYELPGGTRVEAGRFNANAVNSFASIQFSQDCGTVPVVITTINSVNEGDAVAMRLKNITPTGFDYRIQEQESNDKQHASEVAGYIAWEPSVGSIDGLVFEIGRTSNSVTHAFQTLPFYAPFSNPPVFLAGMQTTDGGDTAAVRWQNKQADGVEVKVEEEQSRDTETNHTTEVVGYMVFEAQNPTQEDTHPVNDLSLEAEDGFLSGAFEIGSDPAASGELYVHVPNGRRTRLNGPDERHKIGFTFEIPKDGMYRIKGSVHAASGGDDSFWVKVNGNPAGGYLWDVFQNTNYEQDYVNDRNGADPVEVWLPAGVNTVTVYLREDGTRLDRIELEPVVSVQQ